MGGFRFICTVLLAAHIALGNGFARADELGRVAIPETRASVELSAGFEVDADYRSGLISGSLVDPKGGATIFVMDFPGSIMGLDEIFADPDRYHVPFELMEFPARGSVSKRKIGSRKFIVLDGSSDSADEVSMWGAFSPEGLAFTFIQQPVALAQRTLSDDVVDEILRSLEVSERSNFDAQMQQIGYALEPVQPFVHAGAYLEGVITLSSVNNRLSRSTASAVYLMRVGLGEDAFEGLAEGLFHGDFENSSISSRQETPFAGSSGLRLAGVQSWGGLSQTTVLYGLDQSPNALFFKASVEHDGHEQENLEIVAQIAAKVRKIENEKGLAQESK